PKTMLPFPGMRDGFLIVYNLCPPATALGTNPLLRWTCTRQDQSLKRVAAFWAFQCQNRHLTPPGVIGRRGAIVSCLRARKIGTSRSYIRTRSIAPNPLLLESSPVHYERSAPRLPVRAVYRRQYSAEAESDRSR